MKRYVMSFYTLPKWSLSKSKDDFEFCLNKINILLDDSGCYTMGFYLFINLAKSPIKKGNI